jgi:PAT family beta-lactamase induction signal transducer AmpG
MTGFSAALGCAGLETGGTRDGRRSTRIAPSDRLFKKLKQGKRQKTGCPKIAMKESSPIHEPHARTNWRHAVAAYTDRRVLQVLALGFSSGLPFLLTYSTLSAWLATGGVRRAAIGTFALVGTPYAFKFLWAPLMDRVPPPLPLGRRRGWGITIQILLMGAILGLGLCDPKHSLPQMAALAVLVATLSASQDIVIDAWRVEILSKDQQAHGAAMIQAGYRVGMLVSGAGGLLIAAYAGWFVAYATMAALLGVGLLVFLLGPEPTVSAEVPDALRIRIFRSGWDAIGEAFTTSAIAPFWDFMRRPLWPVILIAIFGYKLGEAMAGVMSTPLYISLGFSLPEIAAASKVFGFFSIVAGALLGGIVTTRWGIRRSLILCGILQSIGNLFFVLQAVEGHRIGYLALCVTAENLTGAMAGTALVTYLSSLCSPAFTATQYALLAALASVGRTVVASSGGLLSEKIGWVRFFALTSVVALPAILLFIWIGPRDDLSNKQPDQDLKTAEGD